MAKSDKEKENIKKNQKKRVQRNYDRGLWTIPMMKKLVSVGAMTEDEYLEYTGYKYSK